MEFLDECCTWLPITEVAIASNDGPLLGLDAVIGHELVPEDVVCDFVTI
jgi:hypothetical protein